jgi:AraC-like DNA-binding protein
MTANNPHILFDSEKIDAPHRREAWVEFMRPLYEVSPVEEANKADFGGTAKGWVVGDLLFGDISFGAQIMEHRRGKHSRNGDHDHLFLQIFSSGGTRAIHGDTPLAVRPGDVHLFDFARDRRSVSTHSRVQGLVLPYEAAGYEPGLDPDASVFASNSPVGYILGTLFSVVSKQLPSLTPDEAMTVGKMITATLQVALGSAKSEAALDGAISARRLAMRQFVVGNLHRLDLEAATLARAFGISRATVFRDFDNGGLQHFIVNHRLDRALDELASGPDRRGRIAQVAEKWGFSSHAHFSRAFKDHFGFSPSDAVGVSSVARRQDQDAFGVGEQWSSWLKR